jgi:hypothetical protein
MHKKDIPLMAWQECREQCTLSLAYQKEKVKQFTIHMSYREQNQSTLTQKKKVVTRDHMKTK